tara:strand:- start:2195 stop:2749 length:555 start_codon:yes stop_codon:yes gene_type:complete
MARWLPFTLHVRIVPDFGPSSAGPEGKGGRYENWRDMQKIGILMYDSLSDVSGLRIATPGGGQQGSYYGGANNNSGFKNGFAVKPQFGDTPAQAMIAGFYEDTTNANIQNFNEVTRFSGGYQYRGPANEPALANPRSELETLVSSFKTLVENQFTADLPAGIAFTVFRLDVAGVIYGDRGYHFP